MKLVAKQESLEEIKERLFNKYGTGEMLLKDIAKDELNLTPRVANDKAVKSELPFPTRRLIKYSPWIVALEDVAVAIFNNKSKAHEEWQVAQDKQLTARG